MSTDIGRLNGAISSGLDKRLAGYFAAAAAIGAGLTTKTQAAVVAHTTPQPFGINGEVNIDFDGDGVAEFQIDHDRYELPASPQGPAATLDYLQIDKNDRNSAANPLPIDSLATYSSLGGTFQPPLADDYDDNHHGSWDAGDLAAWEADYGQPVTANTHTDGNNDGSVDGRDFLLWQRMTGVKFSYDQGYMNFASSFYPDALTENTPIGPTDSFDFGETSNFDDANRYLRSNRLIDEDRFLSGPNIGKSRIDSFLLGTPSAVEEHPDEPQFVGLGGVTHYLGVRFDLHDEGFSNNFPLLNGPDPDGDGFGNDDPNNYWYGWIGIQIDNEADATGIVTGWAYNDVRGQLIRAGQTVDDPPIFTVPEPGALALGVVGGMALVTRFGWQKLLAKNSYSA